MKNKLNIFITFEGGEGTGKTTVAKIVKQKLEDKKIKVFLTREPGGKDIEFAEDIRKIIMKHEKIDLITELLLFEASRREHLVQKIIPALNEGKLVISDRFEDSTIVYQGMVKGLPIEHVIIANEIVVGGNGPKLVFIFDLEPVIGLKRILDNKRETNRFDNETFDFHQKIRQGYLELSEKNKNKYKVINANETPEKIAEEIISILENYEY